MTFTTKNTIPLDEAIRLIGGAMFGDDWSGREQDIGVWTDADLRTAKDIFIKDHAKALLRERLGDSFGSTALEQAFPNERERETSSKLDQGFAEMELVELALLSARSDMISAGNGSAGLLDIASQLWFEDRCEQLLAASDLEKLEKAADLETGKELLPSLKRLQAVTEWFRREAHAGDIDCQTLHDGGQLRHVSKNMWATNSAIEVFRTGHFEGLLVFVNEQKLRMGRSNSPRQTVIDTKDSKKKKRGKEYLPELWEDPLRKFMTRNGGTPFNNRAAVARWISENPQKDRDGIERVAEGSTADRIARELIDRYTHLSEKAYRPI